MPFIFTVLSFFLFKFMCFFRGGGGVVPVFANLHLDPWAGVQAAVWVPWTGWRRKQHQQRLPPRRGERQGGPLVPAPPARRLSQQSSARSPARYLTKINEELFVKCTDSGLKRRKLTIDKWIRPCNFKTIYI
jgi:hypothetical protein